MKKDSAKKKIIFDTIAVFFIAVTPFLYKVYDYLPINDPDAVVSFLGITIGSNGFADVSTYVWFLTVKIIPFLLLVIWFFTSRDWWYHILLIPIAMYAFQLFEAIFSEDDYVDSQNIWWLIPVCMVVIPFVYFIRIKLYDRYVHGIDLDAMEVELHSLKQKQLKNQNIEVKRTELPKVDYRSLSEWLNQELSTGRLTELLRRFQSILKI
jgi:hypothetical protein